LTVVEQRLREHLDHAVSQTVGRQSELAAESQQALGRLEDHLKAHLDHTVNEAVNRQVQHSEALLQQAAQRASDAADAAAKVLEELRAREEEEAAEADNVTAFPASQPTPLELHVESIPEPVMDTPGMS